MWPAVLIDLCHSQHHVAALLNLTDLGKWNWKLLLETKQDGNIEETETYRYQYDQTRKVYISLPQAWPLQVLSSFMLPPFAFSLLFHNAHCSCTRPVILRVLWRTSRSYYGFAPQGYQQQPRPVNLHESRTSQFAELSPDHLGAPCHRNRHWHLEKSQFNALSLAMPFQALQFLCLDAQACLSCQVLAMPCEPWTWTSSGFFWLSISCKLQE